MRAAPLISLDQTQSAGDTPTGYEAIEARRYPAPPLHERAWRDALRELMANDWADIRDRTGWLAEGFTP